MSIIILNTEFNNYNFVYNNIMYYVSRLIYTYLAIWKCVVIEVKFSCSWWLSELRGIKYLYKSKRNKTKRLYNNNNNVI